MHNDNGARGQSALGGNLTAAEFRRLADAHRLRGKTREALWLVMVDGITAYAAAQQMGVEQSTISRARKRLERPLCPQCGKP